MTDPQLKFIDKLKNSYPRLCTHFGYDAFDIKVSTGNHPDKLIIDAIGKDIKTYNELWNYIKENEYLHDLWML